MRISQFEERGPGSERLHFRGLANNHTPFVHNRSPAADPTTISTPTAHLSPLKTTQMSPTQNGVKVLSPSESETLVPIQSTCGDGDMCDWDWGIGSLTLTSHHAVPDNTPTSWGEWFPAQNGFHAPTQESPQRPQSLELNPDENENFEEVSSNNQKKNLRCSSLKTTKTPPGTPGHKKIVRFADCLGLDLVDVKLFLNEIPNVPKSAYIDLQDAMDLREEDFVQKKNKVNKLDRILLASFHQPVEMGDFFDRVNSQKVLLENCYLLDSHEIKGCIRVKNLDFNKSVFIRYTYDEWETFDEIQTTYIPGSCDGFSDRFSFHLHLDPAQTKVGSKVGFACRFVCLGQEYWDNNCNRNYVFHCVPAN